MSLQHVLLGILAEGPAHGYDIKRTYDERFPGAKQLAYGQVYAALSRLQQDGLVELVETSKEAGPERATYALSDGGRESLFAWLDATEPPGPYAAPDLVRKTVTSLRLGADARSFLARQRAEHLATMRDLVRRQGAVDARQPPEARITIDHALFHLDADLRWLDSATARVEDRPVPSTGRTGVSP